MNKFTHVRGEVNYKTLNFPLFTISFPDDFTVEI